MHYCVSDKRPSRGWAFIEKKPKKRGRLRGGSLILNIYSRGIINRFKEYFYCQIEFSRKIVFFTFHLRKLSLDFKDKRIKKDYYKSNCPWHKITMQCMQYTISNDLPDICY